MHRSRARSWMYACLVVLAGNAKVFYGSRSLAGDSRTAVMGLVISGLSLLYARRIARASWKDLGVSSARSLPASVGFGIAVVGALSFLSAIGARALRWMGVSVVPPAPPGDLADISAAALRRRLLVYLWFDTAVPEELLMRSVLFAELRPHVPGTFRRVMLSLVCFVAWHAYLGWSEVPDHNPRALSAKFGSYALGSLIFTAPYLATGHVAGSIVAHWLTDCVLLLAGHPSGEWLKANVIPE